MEEKKTVFDHIGEIFATFGIISFIMMFLPRKVSKMP